MEHNLNIKNDTRDMMIGSYQDHRLDKSKELNDSMTIKNSSADEYTRKIKNVTGGNE